jgi:predicted nucleotidyltransferase
VPRGAVGVIMTAPNDRLGTYQVQLPDGRYIAVRRQEFRIRRSEARALPEPDRYKLLEIYRPFIIYRCIVGSRAYGLDHDSSDIDMRGIYLPPADIQWSLQGAPEQLEQGETDECYWELQKFIGLALKANPNILECLYTPLVEYASPIAHQLLAERSIFLSHLIYQTYNGYVLSQFKKLEQDVRTTGSLKWKHAMHLIRLLLSGITVFREGFVPVRVETHRDQLLAIRHGKLPWEEVNVWRLSLHKEFEAAFSATRLPERPDYERANTLLIAARRSMIGQQEHSNDR